MATLFIAYERSTELGDIPAFEAAIASLGEVVVVHDSLVLLKTPSEHLEVQVFLQNAAAWKVRYVIFNADHSASLMGVRPGVLEALERFLGV